MIELQDVQVRFGSHVVVRGVSLSVGHGERVALVGATGSGKSTVMSLILGSLTPNEGSVRVNRVDPAKDNAALQGQVSMAFQAPSLLPWRTAIRNVQVGLDILKTPRAEAQERAQHWLNRVGLKDSGHKYPYQLSGGMRQRVSLARALAVEPKLLLLDEAFSALDEHTAEALRKDFSDVIRETQVTCILVTHNIEEAFQMSDRVVVLSTPAQIVAEYHRNEFDFESEETIDRLRTEIRTELAVPGSMASETRTAGGAG